MCQFPLPTAATSGHPPHELLLSQPSINHAGLTVIFVSRAHLTTLIKLLPKIPTVRAVICYDNVDGRYRNAMRAHARAHNVWAGDWRNGE
jgi:hypothetical protein